MNTSSSLPLAARLHSDLSAQGFALVGQVDLPARAARLTAPPPALGHAVRSRLASDHPRGIYAHQAMALDLQLQGRDVCLATPTASGKSLVFMSAARDLTTRDPSACVLVLYPMRALLQDQASRWGAFLEGSGASHTVIDGGVPVGQRAALLREHRVVLMTPDVLHAWLLSHLHEPAVADFVARLGLLVLDEAHAYDGVFGTNMAFLLRRLRVASGDHRLIASTATVDDPEGFLRRLTGRDVAVIGPDDDGSFAPARSILHLQAPASKRDRNRSMATVVAMLARGDQRFLVFADSRKGVEQITAMAHERMRSSNAGEEAEPESRVLPYRAGYETDDRVAIQKALAAGTLAGVVATSAMELGLDIGEINVVAMMGVPATMKSFRQRLGRAGRRSPSVCLLCDVDRALGEGAGALGAYLARPAEPSWIYLENRYLQYANALCAAVESGTHGHGAGHPYYADLPEVFRSLLANELDPQTLVAADLYELKQRAANGPHLVFPVRQGLEQSFEVRGPSEHPLGAVTFSQMMREAFPGAIYLYKATAWRVRRMDVAKGRITVTRERRGETQPTKQSKVFPEFAGAMQLRRGDLGFVAEAPVQVSERVLGFSEGKGGARVVHEYGPSSPFSQRPLNHFFPTTGVCWYFPPKAVVGEGVAEAIRAAFCERFNVHESDVGVGTFHSKSSPLGAQTCEGMCLYDAVHGSLRLTQRLSEHFGEIVGIALDRARLEGLTKRVTDLAALADYVATTRPAAAQGGAAAPVTVEEDDWMEVIAPGETAMLTQGGNAREVTVLGFRYTAKGPLYELAPEVPGVRQWVALTAVQAIHGQTRVERRNLLTDEVA